MNLSKERTQAEDQAVSNAVAAKTAVLIVVLCAIFYIALTTSPDPLAAVNSLDTQAAVSYLRNEPPEPAAPTLYAGQAVVQGPATPQPVPGTVSRAYVYPPNGENGNVMTYEHE